MRSVLRFFVPIALVALACATAFAGPENVLIVMNGNSKDSIAVAKYYAAKRGIERKYICKIYCLDREAVFQDAYEETIREPIKKYLMESGLKGQIDYIVLTKGIPTRTSQRWGIDSALTCMFHPEAAKRPNPYYQAQDRFSHKKYQIYLVTRLDGMTLADAKALVDRSLKARPQKGLFLLDVNPDWDRHRTYKPTNDAMRRAARQLQSKGYKTKLDDTKNFVIRTGLMGYYSWGKNDARYTPEAFSKLRFLPGAIADMADSSSAHTLTSERTLTGRRAYIADLVAQGVTGVKGYVQEPYLSAVAVADILFDRYTSGFNLAESFYAASRFIHWRGLILGDPLCAPYDKQDKSCPPTSK